MTISSTLTNLMNKFREKTGLTDKLSVDRAADLMSNLDLHVNPNLLDSTQIVVKHVDNSPYQQWTYNNFDYVLKPYTTYTFSWRSKTDNDKSDKKIRVRIFDLKNNAAIPNVDGGIEFPLTDQRQSYTFTVSDNINSYKVCLYGSGLNVKETWDVTFYDCKLEVGDLATPIDDTYSDNQVLSMPVLVMGTQVSVPDGLGQKFEFNNPYFFEILLKDIKEIDVTKGEKAHQSLNIETDGKISKFDISFYQEESGHHIVDANISQLGNNKYHVSAEYTFENDGKFRIMDFYNAGSALIGATYLTLSQPCLTLMGGGN